jgi:hypothetical protein
MKILRVIQSANQAGDGPVKGIKRLPAAIFKPTLAAAEPMRIFRQVMAPA